MDPAENARPSSRRFKSTGRRPRALRKFFCRFRRMRPKPSRFPDLVSRRRGAGGVGRAALRHCRPYGAQAGCGLRRTPGGSFEMLPRRDRNRGNRRNMARFGKMRTDAGSSGRLEGRDGEKSSLHRAIVRDWRSPGFLGMESLRADAKQALDQAGADLHNANVAIAIWTRGHGNPMRLAIDPISLLGMIRVLRFADAFPPPPHPGSPLARARDLETRAHPFHGLVARAAGPSRRIVHSGFLLPRGQAAGGSIRFLCRARPA